MALKLKGLIWVDPELTDSEVQAYNSFLRSTVTERSVPQLNEEPAHLFRGAAAYLGNGFYVN